MARLPKKRRPPNYLSRCHQWRLLAMVLGLGLVIVAMGELRQPEMISGLEQVFAPDDATSAHVPVTDAQIEQILARADNSRPEGTFHTRDTPPDAAGGDNMLPGLNPALLDTIEDNTSFRAAETAAWFHLWELLKSSSAAELATASRGQVDLVQLLEQPNTYRGQVVTVLGTARRVEVVTPAENELGIDRLYLLTIRPPGGQIWPIRAYALELPPNFPRGDDLHAEVAVTGIFLKNWSYEWQRGTGLAPVVMTRTIQWLEPQSPAADEGQKLPSLTVVALTAVALALALLGYVRWNLRVPVSYIPEEDKDEAVRAMRESVDEGQE